jgi:hypothetical protein
VLLPPSVIERTLPPGIGHNSSNYNCYMYKWTNVENGVWYLGIKKGFLPEDGGEPYWTSSENKEFKKLIQGNKPLFNVEVIEVNNDYKFLQMKEHKMLQEVPNIKTNPATYNLSYGIPPIGKDTLPSDEYLEWFRGMVDSVEWVDEDYPESVKALKKMYTYQVRAKDNPFHIREIASELGEIGNNISNMKPILIFEGVGELFGFPPGSDVVVGKRHGLMAMSKQKVLETPTCRVPYEILEGKSKYFLKALAGFDNKNSDKIKYNSDYEDGAKLLVELKSETGVEPNSTIAKKQLKTILGLKGWSIKKAIARAQSDIKTGKKGKKWKDYTRSELETIKNNADNEEWIGRYMSSGQFKGQTVLLDFYSDNNPKNETAQFRKKLKLIIHHPDVDAKDNYEANISAWKKEMMFWLDSKGFTIDIKNLDHEIEDTKNNYIEETTD